MQKTSQQLVDSVLQKCAQPETDQEELPGYMAMRPKSMTEDVGSSALAGALPGAFAGTMGAAFHPGMAKAIPNDKLRLLAGLLGGAGVGAGAGAAGMAGMNKLLDMQSRAEEQRHLESGQLTPEQAGQHREQWKSASDISDAILQKCALYPFKAENKRFEGTPEEWKDYNVERAEKLRTALPVAGGAVGAGAGGLGGLLASKLVGGSRLSGGATGKEKLLMSLLGAASGGLLGAGTWAAVRNIPAEEAKGLSPSAWAKGLEVFNRRFGTEPSEG